MSKTTVKALIVFGEDLRAELGGRFTLIGTIVSFLNVGHPADKAAVTNLAIYSEIEGIKDPQKITVQIIAPSGEVVGEGNMPTPPQDSIQHGFVVCGKFQGLVIKEDGVHKVVVHVDDKEFSKPLNIKRQPQ